MVCYLPFQVFLNAISKKVDDIYKEQRKSDQLLGKLLPPNVLPALKNRKVRLYEEKLRYEIAHQINNAIRRYIDVYL